MTKLDAALAAKLCAEAMEDDERMTEAPWTAAIWYGSDEGGWAAIGPHHEPEDDYPAWDDDQPGSKSHQRAERDAAAIARTRNNLRALAEQLMAALEELTRLRSDEATMKLSRMLGLGDPVRPDIHASVCRQRDAARREVDQLRKHVQHNDEEYRTMKDVLRAEHQECQRLRADLAAALKAKEEACDIAANGWADSPRVAALRSVGKGGDRGLDPSDVPGKRWA